MGGPLAGDARMAASPAEYSGARTVSRLRITIIGRVEKLNGHNCRVCFPEPESLYVGILQPGSRVRNCAGSCNDVSILPGVGVEKHSLRPFKRPDISISDVRMPCRSC